MIVLLSLNKPVIRVEKDTCKEMEALVVWKIKSEMNTPEQILTILQVFQNYGHLDHIIYTKISNNTFNDTLCKRLLN